MKAIVVHEYGEPEVMQVEEVEMPQPAETQVLVKIAAAGVNPVDTYLRTGIHAHAPALIPYGVTGIPLRPVYHMAPFIGDGVPVLISGKRSA